MTDIESEMRQLRDIEEIKQLKARYFRFLDTKDWEAWRAIFTEDLEFIFTESNLALDRSSLDITVASEGQVHRGRDSFVEWTIATSDPITTVHGGHDPEITITGPDTATGIWGMTDYLEWPSDGPPRGMRGYGHYHENYVRTADGWRVKRVVLSRIRVDALEGGLPPNYVS